METTETTERDVRAEIATVPVWYHTLELAPGVTSPGYFDLRAIVDKLPWPAVAGKRCLDIATFDGFYAFELERRGAAEVVAIDVPGPEQFDWPPRLREWGEEAHRAAAPEHAAGFDVARRLLSSNVRRERLSVYDLDPDRLGRFDVVTCGSLLLHLRDPVRALDAVRSVCRGQFLSVEEIDVVLSVRHPKQPVARLDGMDKRMQWTIPNLACRRRMLEAAGFEIDRQSRLLAIDYGAAHPSYRARLQLRPRALLTAAAARGRRVPHHAALCHARPRG